MPLDQNQLEKFIETLMNMKDQRKSVVYNNNQLREIASDAGFSDSDWLEYQNEIQKQIDAGEAFLKHNNTEDAISHLSRATALNPYNLRANAGMAEAYKQQYLHTQQSQDKENAIRYARICLEIDSGYSPAYALISDLKRSKHPTSLNNKWLIPVAIGLLIFLLILYFFISTSSPQKNNGQEDIPEKNIPVQTVEKTTETAPGIPVIYPESPYLTFETQSSELNNYNTSYNYRLDAYIIPHGVVIDALKLKVELMGSNGKVLMTDEDTPVYKSSITYRPGDRIPLSYLKYENQASVPDLQTVKISIAQISKEQAVSFYESSPPIKTTWNPERPANFDVRFRLRKLSKTPAQNNQQYQALVIEAENTGNLSIKQLKIDIVWKNNYQETIIQKKAYITSSSAPTLKRGQNRLFAGTYLIPENPENIKDFEIIVQNIE